MKTLSIAWKDIQILLKDRGLAIQLFLLPLLFIVIFSGALAKVGGGEADERISLAVVDLDGGEAAKTLVAGLDAAGGVRVELYEESEGMALLGDNEIPRLLTVPEGFSSAIAQGRTSTLRLVNHPDADPKETEVLRLVVEGVASDMSLEIQLLAALRQMGEMQGGGPEEPRSFSVERIQAQARSQFARSETQPLIAVAQRVPRQEAEQERPLGVGDIAVPGITVLFVFLVAQTTARSIYDEKKVGSFRRLLAAPLSKASLLAGKMLPNLVTGIVQIAVMFAFGIFGLRLMGLTPATLGAQPPATVLVLLLIALCSSAFGILIAAIARTEGQIGGLSNLLLWGMSLLGGCLVPLFLLERFLGPLPKVVPHYWANHALVNLMVRGLGFGDVAMDMVILLGFTILFFVVGLRRFEFD